MRKRDRQSGFTLIEGMVVLILFTIFTSMAYSSMLQSRPRDQLRQASQELAHRVIEARGMAVARATNDPLFPDADYVEVELDGGANEYRIVAVDPTGNRKVLQTRSLASYNRSADITMTVLNPPAGQPIQFQPNGSTDRPGLVVITENFTGRMERLRITRAGLVRFE